MTVNNKIYSGNECWLEYRKIRTSAMLTEYQKYVSYIVVNDHSSVIQTAVNELVDGISCMTDITPAIAENPPAAGHLQIIIGLKNIQQSGLINAHEEQSLQPEGYMLKTIQSSDYPRLCLMALNDKGILYGAFYLLSLMQQEYAVKNVNIISNPRNPLRMLNHWDNMDGTIERGYAGTSIFYRNNRLDYDIKRITMYARLLSSIGINGITINNVNVKTVETQLITDVFLPELQKLAEIFRIYGIQLFLSINYAAPIQIGHLETADPLDPAVREWWRQIAANIYRMIPDFGGFLVKADSEFRPGPFTYGRNHAQGANMLAEALAPFNGLLIWRCFVYNCTQDWRDRKTDRARAAYDNFKMLDGQFKDNVILQIKNGPLDFQVREPVSPLFGALEKTNSMLELQITQEYTGQQRHLCYLAAQWKEVLDFDTFSRGKGSPVKKIVDGTLFGYKHAGFAAVANVGADENWTGHDLAQANFYAFGRLAWDPDLSADTIADQWIRQTFSTDKTIIKTMKQMLLESWPIYESYTAPLGIGWMVNPGHHYGPSVDGYEYSRWGTYHRADHLGIGVDRSVKNGTGYSGLYFPENARLYEIPEACPDELILFFHHLPYTYRLKSGLTIIQHIYNTHFTGAEQAGELKEKWCRLKDYITDDRFDRVLKRLEEQAEHAKEWRDVINSYFYRKSGIPDEQGRTIY